MAFDWTALIDVAASLMTQAAKAGSPEAYLRSAVSRAYFGAFGHAHSYGTRFLGYSPKDNPEDHGRLREHLRRKKRLGAADRLGRLRALRNEADYAEELPWADASVSTAVAIKLAQEVLAHLPPPQAKP